MLLPQSLVPTLLEGMLDYSLFSRHSDLDGYFFVFAFYILAHL